MATATWSPALVRCASFGFTLRSINALGHSGASGCAALQSLLGRSSRRALLAQHRAKPRARASSVRGDAPP
jgi:hypothetical protein